MKFDWHKKDDLFEQRYFTGSMPLLTPNHIFKICDGPEAFTFSSIFMKGGEKTCSGGINATSCRPIWSFLNTSIYVVFLLSVVT